MISNIRKKAVVIGGGNGAAICLQALKPFADVLDLFGIISTSDSGGSSGKLRQELQVIPTGDILRAILSLSVYDYHLLKRIFYKTRFQEVEKLNEHNLGNLFLALSGQYARNIIGAIRALEQAVEAVGHIYPVTLEPTNLCAELSDGSKIVSEAEIDRPNYDRSKKIVKVWFEPEANIYEEAKNVIESADYIILGIGSLYTSLVPNLIVKGVQEAIKKSSAKLIYIIGSAYELDGETGPECLSDFVKQLQNYLPRDIDTVFYSTHEFLDDEKKKLAEKHWGQIFMDKENVQVKNFLGFDFTENGGGCDPTKLSYFLKRNII